MSCCSVQSLVSYGELPLSPFGWRVDEWSSGADPSTEWVGVLILEFYFMG